ncbi:hypothetical protein IKQ26_01695 [bacterium]|nr:hypothetical protein [bacterium]
MNFGAIKSDFFDYLRKKLLGNDIDNKDLLTDDLSLFSYFDDFKQYLSDKNLADTSIFSLNTLESMDFVDGKFTAADETSASDVELLNSVLEDAQMLQALDANGSGDLDLDEIKSFISEVSAVNKEEEVPPEASEEAEEVTEEAPEDDDTSGILNTVYSDEAALKYLDTDGDGKLSQEEKDKFEAFVKGDKDKLTAEDLKKAYETMKNGTFPADEYAKFKAPSTTETPSTPQTPDTEDTQETQTPTSTPSVPSTGGNPFGPSSTGDGGDTPPEETEKSPLEGKSAEQLESMRADQQGKINESTEQLSKIQSNTDSEVAEKKQASDKAQEDYFAQLENESEENKQLAQQEKQVLGQISQTEETIDTTKASITEKEGQIAQVSSQISVDESQKSSLQSALDAIPADGEDEEENAAYETQRQEIQSQIDDLDAKIRDEEAQKTQYETEKGDLETQLGTYQDALKELEDQRDLIENGDEAKGIKGLKQTASPDTLKALQAFNDAKTSFTEFKQSKLEAAQSALEEQKEFLSQIDEKLKTVQDKEISRKYSDTGDLFLSGTKMVKEYVDGNPPYLLLKPEGAKDDEPLPLMVYLHGDYQTEGGSLTNMTTPGGVMTEEAGWNLNGFNGYVMIPQSSTRWSSDGKGEQLKGLVDSFKQTHNVSKAVLTGGSSGGDGVIKMVNQDWVSDYFDAALVISGFSGSVKNAKIPVIGAVGTSDNGASISHMKSIFGSDLITVNANHGNIIYKLFRQDADGDGNSDIIQRLFDLIK